MVSRHFLLFVARPLAALALLAGSAAACDTPQRPTPPSRPSFQKPVINKPVTINKGVTINKNITINKSIVINKGGGEASAFATALAVAGAGAGANASANLVIYGGNYFEDVTVHNHYGDGLAIRPTLACQMQEATVVKAIHAVCVAADGREFPASHMSEHTFLDSGFEGEILRCIPGLTLKATIGDLSPSDQGLASAHAEGETLACGPHEALRHYKNGVVKCAPAKPVPDCTERSNLRKFGSGDLFFSYRAKACIAPSSGPAAAALDLSGMPLDGGVGE